ncbi:MAG: choice-of-anchor A family protein [Ignavibacteria bacterium]|jgi:choice-of-anchor A domain-containing protein/uncharacterized repeat protein (TIGR01451 family)|nr:choice-of-anchor A family protein [Ignavibacteria bacterium]MCU7502212.1 choice-of-anchor A family protein [Ignavibacteria bacterium]MCU7517429.1 choice-of-anchor A family protein [Ignavibacteria bacterium]
MKSFTFRLLLVFAFVFATSSFVQAQSGNCDLSGFLTFTQGGWGTVAHGNNPGKTRDKYFSSVFPGGLTVGGTYSMKFNNSSDIKNYLQGGGTPSPLSHSYTNPTSSESGNLGVQLVALTLNVYFDAAGKIGSNTLALKDLVIVSGKFAGKTVAEFLSLANGALGGEALPDGITYSIINDAATAINENFDNGTVDKGYLTCPSTPKPVSLGDKVWLDSDMDGIQGATESGIEDVTVQLYDCSGAFIKETETDFNGNYYFKNLNPGSYKVKFVLPNGYLFTKIDVSGDDKDSDADLTTGFTTCYTLTSGENNYTIDAGICEIPAPKASLGNLVWNDVNKNGLQDDGEPGIANVTVELYQCSGTEPVATVSTNSNGIYSFTNLNEGDYKVKFILPENYAFTSKDASAANDETDSDADQSTGLTGCYTLKGGDVNNSVDAGMILPQQELKADLSLKKTVDNANPKNGDRVSFTVTLSNDGPDAAHGVVVSDLLVQGLDFISATASQGSYDKTTGAWNVGTVDSKASASLVVVVKVNAGSITTGTVDLGVASNYNLFVFGDLVQPSCDTQGRLAVGRDAKLANYSVGDQLSATPGSDVLVVGRNLSFTSGAVYYGNVAYGNSTNLPIDMVSIDGTLRQASPVDFDAAKTYLRNLSSQLSTQAANDTAKFEWSSLVLRGSTPLLNVFNISGADLSKSSSMAIDVPNGAVVLVNVDGDSVSWQGGLTVNGTDESNVLYNFYQARVLKIHGIDVRGSILAPFADVEFSSGVQNGQMICNSLTGQAQFNNVRFIGNIPSERKIYNIAEVSSAVERDPDSTPGNGLETEDDFAKVLVTVSPLSDGSNGGIKQGSSHSWQHVADFMSNEMIWTMAFDNTGNTLAGTWGGKIYKTEDNGQSWTVQNPGMKAAFIWSIVVTPENQIFAGTEKGIFSSSDDGKSWKEAGLNDTDVRSLVRVSGVLYAGTWGKGVYKSEDNAQTWTAVNKGLTSLAVHALTVNRNGEIFAGTFGGGVFKSADNGLNWADLKAGYPFIWALGTTSNGTLYAGTYGDGVYYSADGGSTWSKSNNGLASLYIYSVTVDSKDNVYLSSWAGGVYTAPSNGEIWNALGMAGQGVSSVAVNPSTGSLLVGTSSGAVYKTDFSVTSVEGAKKEVPARFDLEQNYPNPFNPSTTIKFSIPKAGNYSLKVYDVLGKEVAVLINGGLAEGKYTLSFNAEKLSTGIYIYHLQGDGLSMTKKMVLMK